MYELHKYKIKMFRSQGLNSQIMVRGLLDRIRATLMGKNDSSLGGFEPPTFRLTAERANRLRHRDRRFTGRFIL